MADRNAELRCIRESSDSEVMVQEYLDYEPVVPGGVLKDYPMNLSGVTSFERTG